jgi:hypothetical protein
LESAAAAAAAKSARVQEEHEVWLVLWAVGLFVALLLLLIQAGCNQVHQLKPYQYYASPAAWRLDQPQVQPRAAGQQLAQHLSGCHSANATEHIQAAAAQPGACRTHNTQQQLRQQVACSGCTVARMSGADYSVAERLAGPSMMHPGA